VNLLGSSIFTILSWILSFLETTRRTELFELTSLIVQREIS